MMDMNIVLASQSPRRLALLQAAGITPEVLPVHIDEHVRKGESALAASIRLCREKSLACPIIQRPIITADTLVALHDHTFGQPDNAAHAAEMLHHLSGQMHQVITAVCVRFNEHIQISEVITSVQFRPLSNKDIHTYLQHNDIMDKAGAYAIQSGASSFITRISGPLDNVIGLPVHQTLMMLESLCKQQSQKKGAYHES